MKIFLRESSGITPPPVQPPSGDIQIPSFPAGFTFFEGVASTVSIAQYIAGGPILTTLNKKAVAEDVGLSGITFNATTNALVYDGTIGIGTGYNFVVNASDGTNPISEYILPSSVTRTWNGPVQGGATGRYFDAATSTFRSALVGAPGATIEMFFENRLGDWWDGFYPPRRQGTTPWYTFVTIVNFTGPQTSTNDYDVTKLVQMWQSGEIPNYGFFIQRVSGNGDVYFSSPSFSSGAEGPFLLLTYADGTTETLTAATTEGITATAEGNSLSPSTRFPVDNGICFFDLAAKTKRIRTATWRLVAHNAYGAVTFRVFALRWEGQTAGDPPTWGYAQNYPGDVNIQADASTIFVERFQDINFFTRGAWVAVGSSWNPATVSNFQYIVGDTDPNQPQYVPLRPGIPAIRWIIPIHSGGKRMDFSFWGMFGNGPNIQSNYQDFKRLYCRWYERYGEDWVVMPPEDAGHTTGLCGEYIDGTWRNGTVVAQTGRYRANQAYQDPNEPFYAAVTNFHSCPDITVNPMHQYGVCNMNAYTYDVGSVGQASGQITNMNYNNTHRALRVKNRWYCIEQYLQMNDPGVANGIIRFWIDGRLALNRTNSQMINLPLAGITNLSVQAFYGGSPVNPNQMSMYMTAMVISTSYIGPALLGAP